jgi:hypothetical protein
MRSANRAARQLEAQAPRRAFADDLKPGALGHVELRDHPFVDRFRNRVEL